MKTVAALGLALFAVVAQAQTMEFKGVPFGASEAQFRQTLPKFHCEKAQQPGLGERVCIAIDDDKIDFGGVVAQSIVARFLRDQLVSVSVTVRGSEVSKVLLALEYKYGKAFEGSTGQRFQWKAKDGIRIVAERGVEGHILMQNEAVMKEMLDGAGAAGAKSL